MKPLKRPLLTGIVVIITIGVGWLIFSGTEESQFETIIIERGGLLQEVSVTGRITPSEEVDLAFELSGKARSVHVSVGDSVYSGQLLAELLNGEMFAQLAQAKAVVKGEEAKLGELLVGTREEEIQVQEIKVLNAKLEVSQAEKNIVDKIEIAYTKADDAVRNKVDQFFTNPRTDNPSINFQIADSQLEIKIENGRVHIEAVFSEWFGKLQNLSVESYLPSDVEEVNTHLNEVRAFLVNVALAINAQGAGSTFSQATIDGYRGDVSIARTNIDTAISSVRTAEDTLSTDHALARLEEQNLLLMLAGATSQQIATGEAALEKARADVARYQAQLAKTIIRAPISGTVTKQDVVVGEIITSNTVVISLVSISSFEIVAYIPEVDIEKVSVGDHATLTLDAYSDDLLFESTVTEVDPAETVIEGVSTYKVTLSFLDTKSDVRPGMTANIDILTGIRNDVIAIPRRAVALKNGSKVVRVLLSGGEIKEREVTVGLNGSDGRVEIVSGLSEGEEVVVFEKR